MKRLLFGLGFALAVSGGASAQDNAPAATLGRPSATLGRPISTDPIIRAQSPDPKTTDPKGVSPKIDVVPKTMPKAGVGEANPKKDTTTLPMPVTPYGPSGPGLTPLPGTPVPGTPITGMPALPPGTTIIEGQLPGGLPGVTAPTPIPGVVTPGSPTGNCCIPGLTPGFVDSSRWYVGAEFLLWYVKGYSTPPLVTGGPPVVPNGGVIGQPGVSVLFGGDTIDPNPRYGARVSLGYWLSPKWAVEGNFFFLGREGQHFEVSNRELPDQVIARPFVSANTGENLVEQVAFPGQFAGFVAVDTRSVLFGYELNLRRRWWDNCNSRLDTIFGGRALELTESITIREQARVINPQGVGGIPFGTEAFIEESFKTANQFYGAQLGLAYQRTYGRWVFDLTTKLALGVTQQSVTIQGTTIPISNNFTPSQAGGLLALDSNIGEYRRNVFGVVPEASLTIGYNVTNNLRIFAGYNFLYWNNVVRPGAMIDPTLDESKIPNFATFSRRIVPAAGEVHPATRLGVSEDFWAQGVNFGLLFRW